MRRPPEKYVVSIDEELFGAFYLCWLHYEKPCDLCLRKPQTRGLTAVSLVIESDEAADFLWKAKEETGCKLYRM